MGKNGHAGHVEFSVDMSKNRSEFFFRRNLVCHVNDILKTTFDRVDMSPSCRKRSKRSKMSMCDNSRRSKPILTVLVLKWPWGQNTGQVWRWRSKVTGVTSKKLKKCQNMGKTACSCHLVEQQMMRPHKLWGSNKWWDLTNCKGATNGEGQSVQDGFGQDFLSRWLYSLKLW